MQTQPMIDDTTELRTLVMNARMWAIRGASSPQWLIYLAALRRGRVSPTAPMIERVWLRLPLIAASIFRDFERDVPS